MRGAEVAAIVEPDAAMRAKSLGLAPAAESADTLEDLLGRNDLDALVIVSPNDCHLDQLERIAALRPLPVLVEGQLFTDPGYVARVRALSESYAAPI